MTIAQGQRVLFDLTNAAINGGITVQSGASLYFAWDQDISLRTQYILTNGELYIGTEKCPIQKKITIELTDGEDKLLGLSSVGTRAIASGVGGALEMHGAKGLTAATSWTQLSQTAVKGSTYIRLADNVTSTNDTRKWVVGDKIVITSTDFSPLQTEVVTIKSIVDSRTLEIEKPLQYTHFGEVTFGSDQRAEVGLLTRNIVIKGSAAIGAHTMAATGTAIARIEGVEFTQVGQDKIARYPIHFHMVGETSGNWYARFNSIHRSMFRCVTIHASHNITVESNVCYDIAGHAFYLEDGVERKNKFARNLAVMVKPKPDGEHIGSDRIDGVSSYWITNADNYFIDNVAAASYGTGFWLHARLGARGISKDSGRYNNVNPSLIPLLNFTGNRAHGLEHGLQIEATNFDAWNDPVVSESSPATYSPMINGTHAITLIDNLSAYKIRFRGIWGRVNDIHIKNSVFADCFEGLQLATSGAHPPAPSVQLVENTIFVGVSANKGSRDFEPSFQGWDDGIQASYPLRGEGFNGWKIYDGTQGLRNCSFFQYPAPSRLPSLSKYHAPIGMRLVNHGQISTTNFVEKLKFDNVSRRAYFIDKGTDGGKQINFRDVDGTFSGYKNSHILHDIGFYRTDKCRSPEGDNWIACPHKYNQLWAIDMTRSETDNELQLYRNEHIGTNHANSRVTFEGFGDTGVWRYQPIISNGASYLMQFNKYTPGQLALQLVNAERNETTEIALCYPRNARISSVRRGFVNAQGYGGIPSRNSATTMTAATSRTSLAYLNGSSYYWDSGRSLLFIKLRQSRARMDYGNFCPWEGCDFVWIDATGTNSARDCSAQVYSGANSLQITSGKWLATSF